MENLQEALCRRWIRHLRLVSSPLHCYYLANCRQVYVPIHCHHKWPALAATYQFHQCTERYYKGSVVILIFFYTSLWSVKISFLFFFKRLGQNVRWQKILWWCVFAFTAATYFVCIGDIQYACLAAPLMEIMSHCSSDWDVNFQQVTLKFNGTIDVLTDVMSNACLSDPGHRSAANDNSYIHPDKSAMGSQNLTAPQACPDGHLLSCHHYHGLRHYPCRCYQLFVTSARHVLVLNVELY